MSCRARSSFNQRGDCDYISDSGTDYSVSARRLYHVWSCHAAGALPRARIYLGAASERFPFPCLVHSLRGSPVSSRSSILHLPMTTTAMPDHALRGFSVRRTPRACHGACNRLRPGRLRASHAICLAFRTLEPAICARKEGADIESVSTIENILAESLFMRGDFFDTHTVPGFYSTSRHCIPRCSPRNSNSEETANKGAAENCSARHGSCYSYPGVSRSSHLFL